MRQSCTPATVIEHIMRATASLEVLLTQLDVPKDRQAVAGAESMSALGSVLRAGHAIDLWRIDSDICFHKYPG